MAGKRAACPKIPYVLGQGPHFHERQSKRTQVLGPLRAMVAKDGWSMRTPTSCPHVTTNGCQATAVPSLSPPSPGPSTQKSRGFGKRGLGAVATQEVKDAGHSPALARALQGCQVEAPEAQGRRHGEQYSQPAAGHNEGHEQAEVMHSWNLQPGGTRTGRWLG